MSPTWPQLQVAHAALQFLVLWVVKVTIDNLQQQLLPQQEQEGQQQVCNSGERPSRQKVSVSGVCRTLDACSNDTHSM